MNRRERVKKAFHFDKPDRVPMSAFSFDSDFFPVEPHQPISWQPIDYPPHVNGGSFQIENKAFMKLILEYTREAGVRNLEREITSICRKIVKKVVEKGKNYKEKVVPRNLVKYLGIPKYRRAEVDTKDEIGVGYTGRNWQDTEDSGWGEREKSVCNRDLSGSLGETIRADSQYRA